MKLFAWFLLVFTSLTIMGTCCYFCNDAARTAKREYSASTMLKKYEYFKNLSSAIDKKRADIEMYQAEIMELKQNAKDNDDKFEIQQRKSELLGIISIHNSLCSEYNAQMSKFNYRFTNSGDLPETNLTPLPREFKPYINNLNKY